MAVHIQSKDDLEAKLKEAGESLVVIDFSATWCGPCKVIGPVFKTLATEHPNVVFLEVDVDECDEIASEYGIMTIPTFVFLKKGEKITSFSGANGEKLKELIVQHNFHESSQHDLACSKVYKGAISKMFQPLV